MDRCMEHPDAIPPFHECRCPACYRAREDSIPAKLRYLARRQLALSWEIRISDALIHRALSTYLAGHIGLAEMQIELIAALANHVDEQHKQLCEAVSLEPVLLTNDADNA
jgi:hypothetical protein